MDQPFGSLDDVDWDSLGLDFIFGLADNTQVPNMPAEPLGPNSFQDPSSLAMTADTIAGQINQASPDRFALAKPASIKGKRPKQPMRIRSSTKGKDLSLQNPISQALRHLSGSQSRMAGDLDEPQEPLSVQSAAVASNDQEKASQAAQHAQEPVESSENPSREQANTVHSDPGEHVIDSEKMELTPANASLVPNVDPEQRALVLLKRKIRNRQSAKRSRERRMNMLNKLQVEYTLLKEESERLKRACVAVVNDNMWLRQQTEQLRENRHEPNQQF